MIDGPEAWLSMPSLNFEGVSEYMWIGMDAGHLVSTATLQIDPPRKASIAVHFLQTVPGIVQVRLAGTEAWMTHSVRRDGETLWWTIRGEDHGWRFIDVEAVPQQAQDAVARGREKLRRSDAAGSPGDSGLD